MYVIATKFLDIIVVLLMVGVDVEHSLLYFLRRLGTFCCSKHSCRQYCFRNRLKNIGTLALALAKLDMHDVVEGFGCMR